MSRHGVQGFQPDRLIQILAARRLNQVQLATMVGVSPATVSKWRAGSQAPESDSLERLASVLGVEPEWLTRPIAEKVSLPLFRSNASAHASARAMLEARVELAQDVSHSLMKFVDFPDLNIPIRNFKDPEEITCEDIEKAACECRDLWRLGRVAVQDLALAIESAGIILVREETGIAQIEGLSAWSSILKRPIIFLSSDKDNGYRSRFDLAHELGHLILHRNISRSTERDRHKLMERQAHQFAGAFLLPAETIASDVCLPVTLGDLLILKRRWGVSAAAIMMRLHALDLIDDDEKLALFKRRSASWGGKAEPGDKDRIPEQPRLLRRTIELLSDENIMPMELIPRHLGLSPRDIEMLTGLPDGYFNRKERVIHFVRLKLTPTQDPSTPKNNNSIIQFRSPRDR